MFIIVASAWVGGVTSCCGSINHGVSVANPPTASVALDVSRRAPSATVHHESEGPLPPEVLQFDQASEAVVAGGPAAVVGNHEDDSLRPTDLDDVIDDVNQVSFTRRCRGWFEVSQFVLETSCLPAAGGKLSRGDT